jgi:hypothetical protein
VRNNMDDHLGDTEGIVKRLGDFMLEHEGWVFDDAPEQYGRRTQQLACKKCNKTLIISWQAMRDLSREGWDARSIWNKALVREQERLNAAERAKAERLVAVEAAKQRAKATRAVYRLRRCVRPRTKV